MSAWQTGLVLFLFTALFGLIAPLPLIDFIPAHVARFGTAALPTDPLSRGGLAYLQRWAGLPLSCGSCLNSRTQVH